MEGRFLGLPRPDTGKLTGALVVALHQGELVQQGAPLLQVVHVLEGHLLRSMHEVKGHHHGKVGEGGAAP